MPFEKHICWILVCWNSNRSEYRQTKRTDIDSDRATERHSMGWPKWPWDPNATLMKYLNTSWFCSFYSRFDLVHITNACSCYTPRCFHSVWWAVFGCAESAELAQNFPFWLLNNFGQVIWFLKLKHLLSAFFASNTYTSREVHTIYVVKTAYMMPYHICNAHVWMTATVWNCLWALLLVWLCTSHFIFHHHV